MNALKAGAKLMEEAFVSMCMHGVAGKRNRLSREYFNPYIESIPGASVHDTDQELIFEWVSYMDVQRTDPKGRRLPYLSEPGDPVELPDYKAVEFENLAVDLRERFTDSIFRLRIGRWSTILGSQDHEIEIFPGCNLKLSLESSDNPLRSLYRTTLEVRYKCFVFPGCLASIHAGADLARECCALLWAASELDYFHSRYEPHKPDNLECSFVSQIDGGLRIPDPARALMKFDNELFRIADGGHVSTMAKQEGVMPPRFNVQELSALIANCSTEDASRIKRSLHFVPNFLVEGVSEKAVLWLCIAIEALAYEPPDKISAQFKDSTTQDERMRILVDSLNIAGITQSLSDKIAIVIGGDSSQRKTTRSLVKMIYQVRSKVAHGSVRRVSRMELEEAVFRGKELYRILLKKTLLLCNPRDDAGAQF